jgi:hypothetical protein
MFLELKNAEYLGGYKVKVLFNTNEEKIVDFKNYVQHEERKILQPLKNEDFFKTLFVHSEFGTLSWKDEIDLAPEFVYELAS